MAVDRKVASKEPTPNVSPHTGLGHGKPYYISVFCLLCLFALLVFAGLDAEYDSMGWTIQHDEKLVVPDARSFYLGGDQKLEDYREPVSACFGILGPYVTSIGFRLFGMNNYGLRFVFAVVSVTSMALLALSILNLHPSWLGVLFCATNLLNYRYFILTHYALLEDFLVFSLCGVTWLYVCRPKTLLAWLNPLAFFGGALFLCKQLFPVYWLSLLGCIVLSERVPRRSLVRLLFWSLAGLIFFGCLQFAVLQRWGVVSVLTHNIARGLHLFTGGSSAGLSLQIYPEPPGLVGIVPRFAQFLTLWYLPVHAHPRVWFGWNPISQWQACAALIIFFGLLVVTVWLLREKKLSKRTIALGMFLVGMLAVLSPMFFYVKRALPLFPIGFLFLASLLRDMLHGNSGTKMAKSLTRMALWCSVIFLSYYVIWQGSYLLVRGSAIRSHGVERNSRDLGKLVSEKATIYMHCYGLRFFWQARQRIVSGDDQLMNNQMILAKALQEEAKFVLLSGRGGAIDADQCLECPPMRIRKRHLYFSEMSDSGQPDVYVLFELAYGEEGRRGVGAEPS
jgi:hypothetical protein